MSILKHGTVTSPWWRGLDAQRILGAMLLGLFAPSRLTQAKLVLGEETGKEQFEDFYDGEEQGV